MKMQVKLPMILQSQMRTAIKPIRDDEPLPPRLVADYWEMYAKLVLEYIDSDSYSHLAHADKPDWQDADSDLGVEVTSAESSESREAASLYSRLHFADDEKRRARSAGRIEQVGAKLSGGVLFGPDGTDDFALVLAVFKEKLKKLNGDGYKVFGHNQLWVWSPVQADERMLSRMLEELCVLNVGGCTFEQAVVSGPGHNIVLNIAKHSYEVLPFDSKAQLALAEKARKIVVANYEKGISG